ncbi:MAG: aldo/keto reductase [Sulfurimonas sp.]|nr:aldo/keto reductase [Sulfurimonas sp.]
MSNFAFGTIRISEHNPQHISALKEAINSGIKMIDTSSNYMNGASERAVALALNEFDDSIVDDIEIVSKYMLSQNFDEQLKLSMDRLGKKSLDCYLIEYPEEFLIKAVEDNTDKDDRLDEMNAKFFDAFLDLELAIKDKKIFSYGISSDAFSLNHSSEYFLPYEDILTLAEDAANEIGNVKHSLTTIELPINLLEQDGLKCSSWAKENGLRVLANRVFNAQKENLNYRLADYDESNEYYHHLNELMEVCDNEMLKPLYNLVEQLDETKHKFAWIGDYDSFLYTQMIPHIKSCLEVIDEENREVMLNFIDMFLTEYRKMVAYECSKTTKVVLKDIFKECYSSMQECALKFLIERESVDYIVIGMRKPTYVNEIMSQLD